VEAMATTLWPTTFAERYPELAPAPSTPEEDAVEPYKSVSCAYWMYLEKHQNRFSGRYYVPDMVDFAHMGGGSILQQAGKASMRRMEDLVFPFSCY